MKKKSIWDDVETTNINNNKKINDLNTDILIIGGGITGITLAYFLKDYTGKVTLVDKSKLGYGVTSKTTAKITYLQETIYSGLSKYFNEDISNLYYESQKDAIKIIKDIVKNNNIDCDLEKSPSIIFTLKNKNIKKLRREEELLRGWNNKVEVINNPNIKYGLKVHDTYTFHPLKYLKGITDIIKDKVNLYENILVEEVITDDDGYIVCTNMNKIFAKKVVVACHYPFFIYPSFIPIKTYVTKEYVNAARVRNPKNYNAISIDKELHSIRYYKDYLIYGSNMHNITNHLNIKKNMDESRNQFKKFFNLNPEYSWINQDITSHDKLPIIGMIKDNLYIATAYNGWGMTNGTLAAKIISDDILGIDNKFKKLFSPSRKNYPLYIFSTLGIFNYLKSYIQAMFIKYNPKYIKIDKFMYAIYKDKNKKVHIVKLICPHMKCPLIYNNESNTWDCPCHGSRFDIYGNLLEGPAKKNIKK